MKYILSIIIMLLSIVSCAASGRAEEISLMRESIVRVIADSALIKSGGTGFITELDGDKVIITARHVVEDALIPGMNIINNFTIYVMNYKGDTTETTILSYTDDEKNEYDDWCVLEVPEAFEDLPILAIALEEPIIGEEAYCIGFADGDATISTNVMMGDPMIDGYIRRLDIIGASGMSGSPIYISGDGVVGILVGRIGESHYAVSLSIPMIIEGMLEEYHKDVP